MLNPQNNPALLTTLKAKASSLPWCSHKCIEAKQPSLGNVGFCHSWTRKLNAFWRTKGQRDVPARSSTETFIQAVKEGQQSPPAFSHFFFFFFFLFDRWRFCVFVTSPVWNRDVDCQFLFGIGVSKNISFHFYLVGLLLASHFHFLWLRLCYVTK